MFRRNRNILGQLNQQSPSAYQQGGAPLRVFQYQNVPPPVYQGAPPAYQGAPPQYQGAPGNVSTVTVMNPPSPYRQPIPRFLNPGTTFIISGKTSQTSGRFFVNIENENPIDSDILMHFNPRFDGPTPEVVRNSYFRGGWGQEEYEGPPSPFLPGNPFEIMILVEAGRFMVAVNGQHYIAFDHRIPVHLGRFIHISGDVTIYSLKIHQVFM